MAITGEWQFEIDGETFGVDGDAYGIAGIEGLGTPNVRDGDVERARADGLVAQEDYYGGRTLRLTIEVVDATGIEDATDALKAAWKRRNADVALDLRTTGSEARRLFGRPRRIRTSNEEWRQFGRVTLIAEFVATDPRWYSTAETAAALALATSSGGFEFPLTFDLTFGGGGASDGITTVTNAGRYETFPTTRLDGPLTNPTVRNETTGEVLAITATIADGDFVLIDHLNRTVLLGGTASRYEWALGQDFFALQPGDNDIRFSTGAGTGTASLTYRSAWI